MPEFFIIAANDTITETLMNLNNLLSNTISISEQIKNRYTTNQNASSYNVSEADLSSLNTSITSLFNTIVNQSRDLSELQAKLGDFQQLVNLQNKNTTELRVMVTQISKEINVLYSNITEIEELYKSLQQRSDNVQNRETDIQVI